MAVTHVEKGCAEDGRSRGLGFEVGCLRGPNAGGVLDALALKSYSLDMCAHLDISHASAMAGYRKDVHMSADLPTYLGNRSYTLAGAPSVIQVSCLSICGPSKFDLSLVGPPRRCVSLFA